MDSFNKYIKSLEERIEALESHNKPEEIKKINLAYYPTWEDIDNQRVKEFTHISMCFLDFDDTGNPKWEEIDSKRPFADNVGVSIGGWTYRHKIIKMFDDMNPEILFNNLFNDMTSKGYKYLNIDIEYPENSDWIEKILKIANDLKGDIKLSVASGVFHTHLEVYKNCSKYLDWIELMAYDCKIEEIKDYTITSINKCLEYGYDKSQIVMGYSFDKNGDTEETYKEKDLYIKKLNLRGLMKWHIGLNPKVIVEVNNLVWINKWDNPYREISIPRKQDPYDTLTTYRGSMGSIEISYGIMKLKGNQPRLYINVDIQDIEVNMDYMRVGTSGKGWSGGIIGVRSDPEGHSANNLIGKAHTYYFRLKHEGNVDFYREITHGADEDNILISKKYDWNTDTWYNIKFRCFNLSKNIVRLEGYINNELVLEYEDNNEIMYNAQGSVFIRNTSIDEARYKNCYINQLN